MGGNLSWDELLHTSGSSCSTTRPCTSPFSRAAPRAMLSLHPHTKSHRVPPMTLCPVPAGCHLQAGSEQHIPHQSAASHRSPDNEHPAERI